MNKQRVNSPTCDIFFIFWFLEVLQNKIFSKSFTIFAFAIFWSILIRLDQSWTIFNSQYNEDFKNILDKPIWAKLELIIDIND